jgi:hypothetical protein
VKEEFIQNVTVIAGYNKISLNYELGLTNYVILSSELLIADNSEYQLFSDLNYCHHCGTRVYCLNTCDTLGSMRRVYFRLTVNYTISDHYLYQFDKSYEEIGNYTMKVTLNRLKIRQ